MPTRRAKSVVLFITGLLREVPEAQSQALQKTFVLTGCSGTWDLATLLDFLELQ
jgi:hypothetical protein